MLNTIIRKVSPFLQRFLHRLAYHPNRKFNWLNDRRLVDEIKVSLEWSMSDVMQTYPVLTMHEAEQVITMFCNSRHVLKQEGWYLIDGFVKDILYKRG